MFPSKMNKAIAHYSFVSTLFSWVLYKTLLKKKLIKEKDVLAVLDHAIKYFEKLGFYGKEHVEALKEIRALEFEGHEGWRKRVEYAKKIGMI